MASRSVATLKFVGTISLGLLTGVSYTLSTIALPTLLTLPSAVSASHAFTHLTTRTLTDLRIWAGVSTSSFVLSYLLSPRGARHPYLLWTALFVGISGVTDLVLRPESTKTITSAKDSERKRLFKSRKLEASYDVIGDSHSEGDSVEGCASDTDSEEVNGEEIRKAMEAFRFSQSIRTLLSGLGFAMSVVGIWGDGF